MRTTERIAISTVAAGAIAASVWMIARLVNALVILATPLSDAAWTDSIKNHGYHALGSALPLFLLDNGAVAVANSTGYIAIWDGGHAYTAGLYAAAAEATISLTVIAVLIALLLLCIRLLRDVPFTRSLTRWVAGAGIALIAGGALAQLFGWLSRLAMIATVAPTVSANDRRMPTSAVDIDLVPLASGAVLCIVAMAFNAGQRLQRDTVGLV